MPQKTTFITITISATTAMDTQMHYNMAEGILRLPRFFLRVLQGFFLLAELARQADDPRAVGERVPLVFRNFLIKRGAPGALHVLLLTEGKHVLFNAVDFRAQHAKLAFARFRFARQFQHRVMRGGHLVFELLRALVGLFALLAQRVGALFLAGDGLLQAGQKLLIPLM